MAKRPGGAMVQSPVATKSQLIPVLSKLGEVRQKSQLGPIIFTVAVFMLLGSSWGSTEAYQLGGANWNQYWTSNCLILVAAFLTLVSLYFIYRLVGKDKPWWILFACFAFTAYCIWLFDTQGTFVWMYEFFHYDLAGGEPDVRQPFLMLFLRHFLGTGFFEETFKAMPLFVLVLCARFIPENLRSKIGIHEPLDGILLGAAAGGGFAIMETLGQYVSESLVRQWISFAVNSMHVIKPEVLKAALAIMSDPHQPPQLRQQAFHLVMQVVQAGASILNTAPGVRLVIFRSIDLAFGHMAYSGYFGYFIGLSVLKPENRWKILGIGLVSASLPHALWDSIASLDIPPLEAILAVLSYAILAAAVLKAREISPNRAILQPSVVFGALTPAPDAAGLAGQPAVAPAVAAAAAHGAAQNQPAVAPLPPPPRVPAGTPTLRVGARYLVIVAGLRLLEHQVLGLQPREAGGVVAEVTRNPNDPSVLGLTNQSTTAWEVVTSTGNRRDIQPGGTIKLAPGTKIDFGTTDGEVL